MLAHCSIYMIRIGMGYLQFSTKICMLSGSFKFRNQRWERLSSRFQAPRRNRMRCFPIRAGIKVWTANAVLWSYRARKSTQKVLLQTTVFGLRRAQDLLAAEDSGCYVQSPLV